MTPSITPPVLDFELPPGTQFNENGARRSTRASRPPLPFDASSTLSAPAPRGKRRRIDDSATASATPTPSSEPTSSAPLSPGARGYKKRLPTPRFPSFTGSLLTKGRTGKSSASQVDAATVASSSGAPAPTSKPAAKNKLSKLKSAAGKVKSSISDTAGKAATAVQDAKKRSMLRFKTPAQPETGTSAMISLAKPPAIVQLKEAGQPRRWRSPNVDPKAGATFVAADGDASTPAAGAVDHGTGPAPADADSLANATALAAAVAEDVASAGRPRSSSLPARNPIPVFNEAPPVPALNGDAAQVQPGEAFTDLAENEEISSAAPRIKLDLVAPAPAPTAFEGPSMAGPPSPSRVGPLRPVRSTRAPRAATPYDRPVPPPAASPKRGKAPAKAKAAPKPKPAPKPKASPKPLKSILKKAAAPKPATKDKATPKAAPKRKRKAAEEESEDSDDDETAEDEGPSTPKRARLALSSLEPRTPPRRLPVPVTPRTAAVRNAKVDVLLSAAQYLDELKEEGVPTPERNHAQVTDDTMPEHAVVAVRQLQAVRAVKAQSLQFQRLAVTHPVSALRGTW